MKRISISLLLACTFETIYAQLPDSVTLQALTASGYEISNPVYEFPVDQLPSNTEQAFLAGKEIENSYHVCLLFSWSDSVYLNTSCVEIPGEGLTFPQWGIDASYTDGFLELESRIMGALMLYIKMKAEDNQLSFVDAYMYDVNDGVFEAADSARKRNDPAAYCEAYLGAQFYTSLDYRMRESLEWAYENALSFYQKKEYASAASAMLEMEHRCELSTRLYDFMGEDFMKIWSDVTLFYLKAGLYRECVDLSGRLIEMDPEATGVYLQYGDALFALGNEAESKSMYSKYVEQMTQKKMKDKIPSRVLERVQ